MKFLVGKSAVITGSGSGFGLELARKAVSYGMNVVLVDINENALVQAKQQITEMGGTAITIKADVSKLEDMHNVAIKAKEAFGATTLLINNAGLGAGGLIWEINDRDWSRIMGVDFYGVLNGIRAFMPQMLEAVEGDEDYCGYILNTASLAGFVSFPTMGPYNVAKSAVISLSETLQADIGLVTDKIKVSVLAPGFVRTNIANASIGTKGHDVEEPKHITANHEMITNFVNGAKFVAEDIANITFEKLLLGDFYIFSGDRELESINALYKSMENGQYHNALENYDKKAYDLLKSKLKD
ncbi:SDR family NAD(P)-dependent oxidoreductase [Acinetobacter faecalis]|uniref:SDR family NAD(P)-dependent oxidoreductase n=1 Tax=Acinetobacter faecalis TaxID=2665161 RepID=UPI002A9090CD|nr:SDR family NAD(P)-dependent oxidoreductase [Acinetobacter faecalis]MDY6457333.1 SDR family NAD(P)-dependent oxidoreductase [Acinetobacter faecalis]MDY6469310.1 SDR family NAD(P)-dependent oxidoreductase [Acinetobacter faecalis]